LFIEFAADYDFADFEAACLYWKNTNDPDGQNPKNRSSPPISGRVNAVTGA